MSDLYDRIAQQVVSVLERRHPGTMIYPSEVTRDRDLRELGLDSLATVNLMLAIETEFDIYIPQGDMVPDNFRSVNAMATLVSGLALAA